MSLKRAGLIGIVAIVIVVVILINQKQHNPTDDILAKSTPIYEPINSDDVVDYKMSKWVTENSYAKQEDVNLSQQQINQIIGWFNSNSGTTVKQIDQVDPQISAGIAIELKNDREIRIQYAKNEVYVTRNDLFDDGKLVYYKVEDSNISGFFDTILMKKS